MKYDEAFAKAYAAKWRTSAACAHCERAGVDRQRAEARHRFASLRLDSRDTKGGRCRTATR